MTVKRLTRTSLDYEKILGSIPRMGTFAIKNFAKMFYFIFWFRTERAL